MTKRQTKKRESKVIKRETVISAQTLHSSTACRFSVLRGLSPSDLTRYIELFEMGDFQLLAEVITAMENRDHTWKVAAAKARKDVGRRQWQCVPKDGYKDDPSAADQAETLREFYSRIKVTDYRCKNVTSGVSGLIKNIMRSYNDWFAVQEIVFCPTASGHLSARIMRCPLNWFELKDGYMHLRPQQDAESTELEDGGWIISQSDGVGVACSVAYQFKRMAQADLAIYSGRCGHPGIHGKTNATYNTTEWNAIAAAVQNFGKEFSCVTGLTDILEKIDLSISGQLPQPIIIEMMDRAISSLQRGADLSTMSAGTGSGEGASVQDDESTLITADNCAMVTETLQTQLDPLVLAWHYGEDIEIKAGFELIPPESDTTAQDLLTDQALVNMGVKLSKNATLERYNRTEADPSDPDDSALTAPVTAGGIIAESSSSQSALVPSSPQSAPVSAENTTAAAVAKTSLNGAQVTALLDIIAQVESGEMSKDVAPAVMKAAFPLMSDEQIADMLPKSDFANEAEPSKGSPAPADGTDTPADRSGSPGIPDPAAAILNRAAAAILDGSVPFDEAMAAAIAELEKLPGAAADLPDTLEKTLTEAMFTAAANNIQETA